jgi:hypothetical protein
MLLSIIENNRSFYSQYHGLNRPGRCCYYRGYGSCGVELEGGENTQCENVAQPVCNQYAASIELVVLCGEQSVNTR